MSSYVVKDRTIDIIVSFLGRDQKYGKQLMAMNCKAVNQRYNDRKGMSSNVGYSFKFVNASKIQVLKSMRCFLYQCYEGTVPGMKLYKDLEIEMRCLAIEVIDSLPEWKEAEWG